MMLQLRHRALYAAFDRYPAPKGAAVHIHRMAQTLFEVMDGGVLYVLGDASLPAYQREGQIEIVRHVRPISNFLERTRSYGRLLHTLLDEQSGSLRLCHFRDPWSGIPILTHPAQTYQTVYEVNGLPSLELPYAYPSIAPRTLAKIRALEAYCWSAVDEIITPSTTIKNNLVGLGAPVEKITVIPNGADIADDPPRPVHAPAHYLLYFGGLHRWQGIDVLLRAFALLNDYSELWLVICASHEPSKARPYRKLSERLGIAERIIWLFGLPEEELAPWRRHALLSLAPLTACTRNLEQGCCPLKVLESMAAGVPVVASDLPAVRELVRDGIDGRLVRPDRPAELARAVQVLLEDPAQLQRLGDNARQRIVQLFTWKDRMEELKDLYRRMGSS